MSVSFNTSQDVSLVRHTNYDFFFLFLILYDISYTCQYIPLHHLLLHYIITYTLLHIHCSSSKSTDLQSRNAIQSWSRSMDHGGRFHLLGLRWQALGEHACQISNLLRKLENDENPTSCLRNTNYCRIQTPA